MSGYDDYPGDMLDSRFTDADIELLLSGATPDNPELADLAVYVESIRNAGRWTPAESQIALVSSQAAEIARSTTPPRAIPGRGRRSWRFRPQVAVTSAVVLLVFSFTGLAAASNDAAPGEPLYAIDIALERIGIGAGHVEERLEEADTLLSSGKTRLALAHAAEAIDLSTADAWEAAGLEEAKAAMIEAADLIDEGQGPDALRARENVSAILILIKAEHQATDAGRREFGQRVAALARQISIKHDAPRPFEEDAVDEPADTERPGDVEEPASTDQGPPMSVPGVGDPPGNNSNNGNSQGESRGETGNSSGNTGPGNNQGGSNGNGGPPPGSPSETAPGQGKP
jgi:hypothetical protein